MDEKKKKQLTSAEMQTVIGKLCEKVAEFRVAVLYLKFDVEATRREREYWKEKYARS
jgi:hypothetical protein